MAWIVLPKEYADTICDVLEEIGCDLGGRYDQEDLAWGNAPKGAPSYDKALEMLDEWHTDNVWSNDPVAVPTQSAQQSSVVKLFQPGAYAHEQLIAYMHATVTDGDLAMFYEDMLRNGAPSRYVQTMQAIRDNFRLDRL